MANSAVKLTKLVPGDSPLAPADPQQDIQETESPDKMCRSCLSFLVERRACSCWKLLFFLWRKLPHKWAAKMSAESPQTARPNQEGLHQRPTCLDARLLTTPPAPDKRANPHIPETSPTPAGPAEQFAGGSLFKSDNSFWIRFNAIALHTTLVSTKRRSPDEGTPVRAESGPRGRRGAGPRTCADVAGDFQT